MLSYAGSDLSQRQKHLVQLFERVLGKRKLSRAIDRFNASSESQMGFFNRAAQAMRLNVELSNVTSLDIPAGGPLLIISNHPFGTIDGLAIGSCIENVRDDLRIIVWDAIDAPAPEQQFMALDLSENGVTSLRQNVKVRRAAQNYLSDGGAILLFPSGSVERSESPWSEPLEEPWTSLAGKLALASKATVLPVFVEGHNSRHFHIASFFGETVRRAMFLHETTRLIGETVRLHFGHWLTPEDLAIFADIDSLTQYLRACVLGLDPKSPVPLYDHTKTAGGRQVA